MHLENIQPKFREFFGSLNILVRMLYCFPLLFSIAQFFLKLTSVPKRTQTTAAPSKTIARKSLVISIRECTTYLQCWRLFLPYSRRTLLRHAAHKSMKTYSIKYNIIFEMVRFCFAIRLQKEQFMIKIVFLPI